MPLNKSELETKIKDAFKKAKATPPPADPKDADKVQEQINAQLAKDLAAAIDAFIRGGDVKKITVDVNATGGGKIGTGTQTGVGKVE
ncbi:MAG: hypothetical protein HY741_03495 [Chloroflexi bacterium]|nr:hypothetical protein [Chloroflexota bacterium]